MHKYAKNDANICENMVCPHEYAAMPANLKLCKLIKLCKLDIYMQNM